jgi:hypothetical protein
VLLQRGPIDDEEAWAFMVHVMRKLDEIELKTAAAEKGGEEMTGNDDEEISDTNHNSLMDLRPTHSNILRSPVSPPSLEQVWKAKAI